MKKRIVGIKTKELIPFIHDGKKIARFSFGSIPVGTERNTYNYNFWVYINDYDYRVVKISVYYTKDLTHQVFIT